jgi:hypothetical protein
MNDNKQPDPFEPFITVTLGNRRLPYMDQPSPAIAVTSNCPGTTAIHWYDPRRARALAAKKAKSK